MLSKRLKAVADMVTKGNIIADIGTDHGYVPIYLVKNNICPFAYAMDINEGPIKSAINNIKLEGLEGKIEAIQSNGLEKFKDGMAQSVVIAGMGGDLIVEILKASDKLDSINELILSPHKRIDLVRKYLHHIGWKIICEEMLIDTGRYYTVIKAVKGKDADYNEVDYQYGKILLDNKNLILRDFLQEEWNKFCKVKENMVNKNVTDFSQVENVLDINQKGRARYD